jgi:hypothetical protein
MQASEVHDLLAGAHRRVEPAFLRHVPPPALVLAPHGPAVEKHRAPQRLDDAEHHPHESRLARAVRSEQSGHQSRLHAEAEVVEDHCVAEAVRDPRHRE